MKRLAVFLDGTWNEPGDNTNVWRLCSMLAPTDSAGQTQLAYYDSGVGTRWYDRFRGGVAGAGLARNIRYAYQWLIENFEDGDEIYLFGFSRGAFSARSLAGMLAKCGLLIPGAPMPVLQIYERYENPASRPRYALPESTAGRDELSQEDRWMVQYSRNVRIRMIGVWDTVGTLGIRPWRSATEQRGEYNPHFTRPSRFYDLACQALAIDEHRRAYSPSLWYRFLPAKKPQLTHRPPPEIEQRWFAGAHSNVGGGYRNDVLAQLPLGWLQMKAANAGLRFAHSLHLTGEEHLGAPANSYADFLGGAYRLATAGRRHYRRIGRPREAVSGGWLLPHAESIDGTVFDKWRAQSSYRPANLREWALQHRVEPEALFGPQAAVGPSAVERSAGQVP